MVRFVIIGAVIALAYTLYAIVDVVMTHAARARGVSKPAWVLIVVLLPVIGATLWFTLGKDRGATPPPQRVRAPEDDPRFATPSMSNEELDEHMRELEERLRELDDEKFPGEPGSPTPGKTEGKRQNETGKKVSGEADGAESNADSTDGGDSRPESK